MLVYVALCVVRCVLALKLGKNPRPAECSSRNHKTVCTRNIAHFFKTLQIDYVAVRDDGNIECLFNRFRDSVVGNTAVKLFSVSRVHAHCARSALLRRQRTLHSIGFSAFYACAHFYGYGTFCALAHRLHHFANQIGIFISALPSPLLKTFLTGQPMFISTISKFASLSSFAALYINSGSLPKS